MSESNEPETDLQELREQKRKELQKKVAGDETPDEESATPGKPVHVEGESHLDQLVADNEVVLVDFYADWCGPCKMLEPAVESIASSTDAVVAKVDIDEHQAIARNANVRGVPTLVLYAGGQPAERLVGVQDESSLRSLVKQHGG
jgi:thioredoxin 1